MDKIRDAVLEQLRLGTSPVQIMEWLKTIQHEVIVAKEYLQAIHDSDFRP